MLFTRIYADENLQIANFPENSSVDNVRALFSSYGGGGLLKNIWVSQLESQGTVVLVFYDLRDAESACRHYAHGAVVKDEMLTGKPSSDVRTLSAGYLTLDEADTVWCLSRIH